MTPEQRQGFRGYHFQWARVLADRGEACEAIDDMIRRAFGLPERSDIPYRLPARLTRDDHAILLRRALAMPSSVLARRYLCTLNW